MFKHILSQQKHSNTRISPHATLSVLRRASLKKALRLLRTNSVRESFELKKKEFLTRLTERGYPRKLVETILAEVRFESRKTALQSEPKTSKKILPFVTTFNPATRNVKKILMKHWHLITGNNTLAQLIYQSNAPIVAYRKEKYLKDSLVRAKIPSVYQHLLRSYTR